MRTKLSITEGIFPMPVLMVATYNEDGSVNVMNAAWGTMQERETVVLNLTETHKTVKNIDVYKRQALGELKQEDVVKVLTDRADAICADKEKRYGSPLMREFERVVLLRTVDTKWMEHIDAMEELRKGIYLRSYGPVSYTHLVPATRCWKRVGLVELPVMDTSTPSFFIMATPSSTSLAP